jgi:hypothetical protein
MKKKGKGKHRRSQAGLFTTTPAIPLALFHIHTHEKKRNSTSIWISEAKRSHRPNSNRSYWQAPTRTNEPTKNAATRSQSLTESPREDTRPLLLELAEHPPRPPSSMTAFLLLITTTGALLPPPLRPPTRISSFQDKEAPPFDHTVAGKQLWESGSRDDRPARQREARAVLKMAGAV